MHRGRLPHYIKAHRKRSGLSQGDVAFLLSMRHSAPISRYEHFKQQPYIETAIALEILFRTPVREIFAGVSENVESKIESRAELLVCELGRQQQSPKTRRKIETLRILFQELKRTPKSI